MLLLKEFDIEIRDNSGVENLVINHFSIIQGREEVILLQETFVDEHLFKLYGRSPWFVSLVSFLVANMLLENLSKP